MVRNSVPCFTAHPVCGKLEGYIPVVDVLVCIIGDCNLVFEPGSAIFGPRLFSFIVNAHDALGGLCRVRPARRQDGAQIDCAVVYEDILDGPPTPPDAVPAKGYAAAWSDILT